MSMTDPIADLLTRIRNAHLAKHDRLDVPASKLKVEICRILKEEGLIKNFRHGRAPQPDAATVAHLPALQRRGRAGDQPPAAGQQARPAGLPRRRRHPAGAQRPGRRHRLDLAGSADRHARRASAGSAARCSARSGKRRRAMSRVGRMPIPSPRGSRSRCGTARSSPKARRARSRRSWCRATRSRSRTAGHHRRPPGRHRSRARQPRPGAGALRQRRAGRDGGLQPRCSRSSASATRPRSRARGAVRARLLAPGASSRSRRGSRSSIDAKANQSRCRGADRQKVGQVAAEIRGLRKPDPYKGKGIKYADEVMRRKVGKAGGK